jgi:hypothetical protein
VYEGVEVSIERRAQDLSFHLFSLGLGLGFDAPKRVSKGGNGNGKGGGGVGAVLLQCLSGLSTVDWMLAHGRSFELAFYWDGLVEYSSSIQGSTGERSGLLLARDSYQQQLLAQQDQAKARLMLPENSSSGSSDINSVSSLVEVVRRHAVVSAFFSIVGEPGTAIDFGEQAIELLNTPSECHKDAGGAEEEPQRELYESFLRLAMFEYRTALLWSCWNDVDPAGQCDLLWLRLCAAGQAAKLLRKQQQPWLRHLLSEALAMWGGALGEFSLHADAGDGVEKSADLGEDIIRWTKASDGKMSVVLPRVMSAEQVSGLRVQ